MTEAATSKTGLSPGKRLHIFGALVFGAAAGACTQLGPGQLDLASATPKTETASTTSSDNKAELAKATEYWGKEFSKNPRDPKAALSYARNLRAMGDKRRALVVLQQTSIFHPGNRELNGEYGRLALEFDQISVAQKLLEQADDPANPDWRVISARGTVLAKQGSYHSAIPYYERALTLAPDQPSILSNLALAHAMDGHPDRAEPLLQRAAKAGNDPRVTQNLALVLGLQGKYADAKVVAGRNLTADDASANVEYLRRIVMLDPQPPSVAEPFPAKLAADPKGLKLKGTRTDGGTSGGWAPVVAATPARP
jgi:Flp pilus assembly protein TadD